jgi:hypothetical protein
VKVQAIVGAHLEYDDHLEPRSVPLCATSEHCVIEAIAKVLKVS